MAGLHVQTAKTIDNDGNNSVLTASMVFGAGALALMGVIAADNVNPPVISSIVMSGGAGSFVVDKTASKAAGGFTVLAAVASLPNVSGAHTVTVTFANPVVAATVFLTEVSGAATSSVADGVGASAPGGPSTTPDTGLFTTTNSDDFWYCAMGDFDGSGASTVIPGVGWTLPANGSETNGAANQVGGVEYRENPGATSGNGTWVTDNNEWAVAVMAYAAAGGAVDTLWAQSVM